MPKAEDFLTAKAPDVSAAVIAIAGDEAFLRGEVLATVTDGIKQAHADAEVIRLDGYKLEMAAVLDELRSRGLFGGYRVVVVDDPPGKNSFIEAHKEKLADYLAKPAKGAQLVLVAEKIDGRSKFAKNVAKQGLRVDCEPFKSASLVRWLIKRAKTHQIELANDVAEFFIACAGEKMGNLAAELEKLDLYLDSPEGKKLRPVSQPMIEDILGYRGSTDTWKLLDHMAMGDLPAALRDTHTLLANGESPYAMIGLVTWKLKSFWRGAGLQANGLGGSEIVAQMKMPPFQKSGFLAALQNFDLPTCRAILDQLCEADRKGSPLSPERGFEIFVMKLCRQVAHRRAAHKTASPAVSTGSRSRY